jgi:hypothetical protein
VPTGIRRSKVERVAATNNLGAWRKNVFKVRRFTAVPHFDGRILLGDIFRSLSISVGFKAEVAR